MCFFKYPSIKGVTSRVTFAVSFTSTSSFGVYTISPIESSFGIFNSFLSYEKDSNG